MMENYLTILEESLKKKQMVLEQIAVLNREQTALLSKEGLTAEEIDASMDKKEALIQKLEKLDEGFEVLYDRIKEQIRQEKERYKEQIVRIQILIKDITEKTASVQAQEERNRKLMDNYFLNQRRQIKQNRQSTQMAYGYFKNMNNSSVVTSQFMDQKK